MADADADDADGGADPGPLDPGRLEAGWPAQEPPVDFAERVLQAVARERRAAAIRPDSHAGGAAPGQGPPSPRARFWAPARPWVALAASLLLCGTTGAIAYRAARTASPVAITLAPGTVITASERREVRLGERAVAVLEAGAELAVERTGLVQRRGDVFYRVTRTSTPFAVTTAAGEVAVLGTCFRVKVKEPSMGRMNGRDLAIGAAGATLGALVFVGVYEGRVRLGHASGSVELGAGQAASSDSRAGWQKSRASLQQAEEGFDRDGEASLGNTGLRHRIRGLREELRELEQRRTELETELGRRASAAATAADAGAAGETARRRRGGLEFDLSPSDWAELAKTSTVKYRVPCQRAGGWKPSSEKLEKLGLAPDDAQALTDAYSRSNQRVWTRLRPLCIAAVGSAEVADRLGVDTCVHTIVDVARKAGGSEGGKDGGPSAGDVMRQVGEVRAGSRAAPGADEPLHPVMDTFLTLTAELGRFEAELAQQLGPDEAHRIAYSDELCTSDSTWGGRPATPPPR